MSLTQSTPDVPTILAIDPGKSTGWCFMKFGGEIVERCALSIDDFSDRIYTSELPGLVAIVFEDFRIFSHRAVAQSGSAVEAAQVIGILRGNARHRGVRLIAQQPGEYRTGAKYVQYKLNKGHCPDDISAWLHGVVYLESINQLTTALERKLQNDNRS